MKIRFLIILLSLIFCAQKNICAQTNEFAPVGAKWWYNSVPNPIGTGGVVATIESLGDTMIAGNICRKVIMDPFYDYLFYSNYFYIYEDSGRVYRYYKVSDEFHKIYDFNLEPGDSYTVYTENSSGVICDSLFVELLSTEIININGMNLIQQNVLTSGSDIGYVWGDTIIERIGNNYFFVPYFDLVDIPFLPLRCYEDTIIGHYETGNAESCDFILELEIDVANTVSIFPNPVQNYLNIIFHENNFDIDKCMIYSIDGRIIFTNFIQLDERKIMLDLHELQFGIYYAKLISINKNVAFINIVKL